MNHLGLLYLIILFAMKLLNFIFISCLLLVGNIPDPVKANSAKILLVQNNAQQILSNAFSQKISNLQVQGEGVVIKLLNDDNEGDRHQKFIIRLKSGQTLLIAHNIDIAPRVGNLKVGDKVNFYGEYEWNSQGGVIHWTHKDPQNKHPHGWLKHQGKTYQ